MRLINIETLELKQFEGESAPPYAILSHRWTTDELNFETFSTLGSTGRTGLGFDKIRNFCAFLKLYPHLTERVEWNTATKTRETVKVRWAWVDTVCIDKRNSAELSEAVNSMWTWYRDARFCVAYLSDVSRTEDFETEFVSSEWFRRGWTLQELLAPAEVWFCNASWNILGSKRLVSLWMARDFLRVLSKASKIPVYYLDDPTRQKHQLASVAQKMNWASRRKTTRPEDMAYCLLGLFNITMPLVYGEGHNAFRRLQQEIVRQSNDETIFAWRPTEDMRDSGLLAPSPECFSQAEHMHRCNLIPRQPYRVTNKGIKMQAPLIKVRKDLYLLQVNCVEIPGVDGPVGDSQYHHGITHGAHGCMVPLKKDTNGVYLRAHISRGEEGASEDGQSEAGSEVIEGLLDESIVNESLIYIHPHTPPTIRTDPDFIASRVRVVAHDCLSSQPLAVIWYDKSSTSQEASSSNAFDSCDDSEDRQDSLVSEDPPASPVLPRGLILPRASVTASSRTHEERISSHTTETSAGIPSAARKLIQQVYMPTHVAKPPRFVQSSKVEDVLSPSNETSSLTPPGAQTPTSSGLAVAFAKLESK